MSERREPTEGAARAVDSLAADNSPSIGLLTFEDGTQRELTADYFIGLMKKALDEENPDADASRLLDHIIKNVIDYATEQADRLNLQIPPETLDALQTIYNYLQTAPGIKKKPWPGPIGRAAGVKDYVRTKDLLSKAVFGEPGRKGRALDLLRETPGGVTLWETKGKEKKQVIVYTRIDLNEEMMKKAGITVGKHPSSRGREVFFAMLSHALAGNRLLSPKMIGRIIYGTKEKETLTPAQEKYIVDGATEVFGWLMYMNLAVPIDPEQMPDYVALLDAVTDEEKRKIENANIIQFGQLFPGRITKIEINGQPIEHGIEIFDLPTIYKLQNALNHGQILRVPVDILEIEGGYMDEDMIKIRAYLLSRIDAMKHGRDLSRDILFTKILAETGIDPTDRAQRNKPAGALRRAEKILTTWKKKAFITDYEVQSRTGEKRKKGGKTYKIHITL